MNIKSLYIVIVLKDSPEKFSVEEYQKNNRTGNNELLITIFEQKLWLDATLVKLYKGKGSTFCWKDFEEGRYIELNDTNEVCPLCGWWKCHVCNSCCCNFSGKKEQEAGLLMQDEE